MLLCYTEHATEHAASSQGLGEGRGCCRGQSSVRAARQEGEPPRMRAASRQGRVLTFSVQARSTGLGEQKKRSREVTLTVREYVNRPLLIRVASRAMGVPDPERRGVLWRTRKMSLARRVPPVD